MIYWEIWTKFADATAMFWLNLSAVEKGVVIYVTCAFVFWLARRIYRAFISSVARARPAVVVLEAAPELDAEPAA